MEITLVLLLVVAAIVVMALEIWPVDVVAMLLLLILILSRILNVQQAFNGFGDASLIMIGSVLVMTAGIVHTGIAHQVGLWIGRLAGDSRPRFFFLTLTGVALLSAFINNVAATAMFLPIVLTVSRRKQWSPSRFLMPIAFGSILGGTCTLIGTSTNVAVSSSLAKYQLTPFSLFEFTPVGLPIALIGISYLAIVGKWLIPDRAGGSLTDAYNLREYLTEILVTPNSALAGKPIPESGLRERYDVNVLGLIREDQKLLFPTDCLAEPGVLQGNDLLLVEGRLEKLMQLKEVTGVEIKAEAATKDLDPEKVKMMEVIVLPGSDLVGQTLKGIDFRRRFGLNVLALYRRGRTLVEKISRFPLRIGDTLLVLGPDENVAALRAQEDLMVLGEVATTNFRRSKAHWALAIFLGAVSLSAAGWLPVAVCFLLGATLMVMSGCLTVQEAYESIHWQVLVLIAGMFSLGTAMESTGAARLSAEFLMNLVGGLGALPLLAAFFWITVLLTQPLSNAAAALLVLPTAINTAELLGANPRTFAMMVSIAASISLITPFEPACLLVYGPGKYQFLDFVKNGALITLLAFLVCFALVPLYWPL